MRHCLYPGTVPVVVPVAPQYPTPRPHTPVSLAIEPAMAIGTGPSTDPSVDRMARFTPAT
jgi:hypothetical protein